MPKPSLPLLMPVAALTLLAAANRGLALGDRLWLDELHTSWVVTDSVADVGPRARLGNQQPLYFYLPWITINLLGEREWTLRLPSYLAGIALIPAAYALARWFTASHLAGLVVAALVMLDRQAMFYAQEARGYALVQLAAVGQFALVYGLITSQRPLKKLRAGLVLLSAVMFYLHYTTALLAAAAWLAIVISKLIHRKWEYRSRDAALDLAAYVLLIAPTLPHLRQIAQRRENWAEFVPQPDRLEVLNLFPLDVYLLAPLVLGGILIAFDRLRNRSRGKSQPADGGLQPSTFVPAATVTACWLLVPLTFALISTQSDLARIYFPRYLIGASVAAMLVAGLAVGLQRRPAARLTICTALLYLAAWRGGWLHPDAYSEAIFIHSNENWRDAVAAIETRDPNGTQPVLIEPGLIETRSWHASSDPLKRAFCSLPVRGIYDLEQGDRAIIAFARGAAVEPATPLTGECWILVRNRLPDSLRVGPKEIELPAERCRWFGGVGLCKLTIDPDESISSSPSR